MNSARARQYKIHQNQEETLKKLHLAKQRRLKSEREREKLQLLFMYRRKLLQSLKESEFAAADQRRL